MTRASPVRLAIAALRGGRPVRIDDAQRSITIVGVETATPELLALLDPEGSARLLISGERAAALSLGNSRDAADPGQPVLIARPEWMGAEEARAMVDPGRDLERAPSGPLQTLQLDAPRSSSAALTLARAAGLLPALWVVAADAAVRVEAAEVERMSRNPELGIIARSRLPLGDMPPTQIIAFRALDDGQEHVALLVGAFGGAPPLVRLHSECLTGDVFGSLKCDCGPQLKEALRTIGEAGGGVLLYLRQEGRGIGLANKIRAYALQDRGLDTVEANRRLGFLDDERDYAAAAAMLKALGIAEVRLLTNNPAKVEGLEAAGIRVAARIPHHMPANPHNADYLATKREKSGHLG